jgi:nucleotide-binding universal stress UspA family protein
MEQSASPQGRHDVTSAPPVFASVLCGIDGSRASLEAARQAAVLARGGSLKLVAITWEQGTGATAVAVLSRWRALNCLDRALQEIRALGVRPDVELIDDAAATTRLLRESAQHDLLVVGIHGHSRPGGILVGSTASAALHRAPVPLLIARAARTSEAAFPERIMLALDGSAHSHAATEVALAIAARHAADVDVVTCGAHEPVQRHAIAGELAAIFAATGAEPAVHDEPGPTHRAIAAAATSAGSTLVVTGSRGLGGAAALRSVSERIGHEAPCSVLVVGSHPQPGDSP